MTNAPRENPALSGSTHRALMKGLFQRDDLTALAVSEGWFLTGDIGFIDERGRLVLRGRERDEINKGGMKIYPADIDTVVERFEHASRCMHLRYR
jgi:long-chain acyl-CoA synthetase